MIGGWTRRSACFGIAAALVAASPAPPEIRLDLTPQKPVSVAGRVNGYDYVDYLFAGTEGHTVNLSMTTANRSAYFNLTPADSDTAIFIGSVDGSKFSGKLPATGDYRVRVYLMRSAARRGEQADFRLRGWVLPTR